MCFSIQQSLCFFAIGAAITAATLQTGRSRKSVLLAGYFTAMEGLQVLQYLVIDDCSSKFNQLLTLLGLVHVAFQPFMINNYLFGSPAPSAGGKLPYPQTVVTEQGLNIIMRRMSLASAAFILLKILPAFVQFSGAAEALSATLSLLMPPRIVSVLVSNTCASPEMACGEKLCSLSGKYHLAWSVPMIAAGYWVPSLFQHCFFSFVPAIVCGGMWHKAIMLLTLITGPLATEAIIWSGGLEVRRMEWAAVWCLASMGQVLLVFIIEIVMNGLANGKWWLPKDCELAAHHIKSKQGTNGVTNAEANHNTRKVE